MKSPSTKLMAAAAVVVFVVVAGIAGASVFVKPGVHNGVITACIEPVTQGNAATSGDLNMFHCAKGAKQLSWHIKGPAGQAGAKGAEGAEGGGRPCRCSWQPRSHGREGRDGCEGASRCPRYDRSHRRYRVGGSARPNRGRRAAGAARSKSDADHDDRHLGGCCRWGSRTRSPPRLPTAPQELC